MRKTIFTIAILMGGWMVINGLSVLIFGKYIGPDKPGPWADIISAIGLDPMRFGLVFVAFGIDWIVAGIGIIKDRKWGYNLALIIAVLSLWYLTIGTLLAVLAVVLIVVQMSRKRPAA